MLITQWGGAGTWMRDETTGPAVTISNSIIWHQCQMNVNLPPVLQPRGQQTFSVKGRSWVSVLWIIKAQWVSKQIKTLLQKQAAMKSGPQVRVHSLCLRLYHQRELLWPISLTSLERWSIQLVFWGEDITCWGTGVFCVLLTVLLHYWSPHNSSIASHNRTQFLLTQEYATLRSKSGRFFLSFSLYYLLKI